MKLWRKVYGICLVIGTILGLTISFIFRNVKLLPGLSLVFSGMLIGIPFGIVIDREILKEG